MWYLVMRRPVRPREEWSVSLDQHLGWLKQQHEAGTILFSGLTSDRKLSTYVVMALGFDLHAAQTFDEGGAVRREKV